MQGLEVLTIFDFDDTLIRAHDLRVRIVHADGTASELPSDEYATYDEKPGDVIDFSDFDRYPHGAEPIEKSFDEITRAISDGHDVVVLTARKSSGPVRQFLEDHGISGMDVVGVGSSDPLAKARYVIQRIKNDDFDLVQVYEDNIRNIRAIKKVVDEHGTSFKSVKVAADGSHITLERRLFLYKLIF